MYRPRAATYLGAMQTERRAALEALHERIRSCLVDVEPKVLSWRSSPGAPTVAELVGLLLMDLDLLSSHSSRDQAFLPEFATEFMNKRLARRLSERYKDRDLVEDA